MKQLQLLRYHAVLVPELLKNMKLKKELREAKRKLFGLLEKESIALAEEAGILREEYADVDEKGEKVVITRMGDKVQYSITGENEQKLNLKWQEHLFTPFTLDVLPADEVLLPKMAEVMKKADEESELTQFDEAQVLHLIGVLDGSIKPEAAQSAPEAPKAEEAKA